MLRFHSDSIIDIEIDLNGRLQMLEAYSPSNGNVKIAVIRTPCREPDAYNVQIKNKDAQKYVYNHITTNCSIMFKLPKCSIYIKHPIPKYYLYKN